MFISVKHTFTTLEGLCNAGIYFKLIQNGKVVYTGTPVILAHAEAPPSASGAQYKKIKVSGNCDFTFAERDIP